MNYVFDVDGVLCNIGETIDPDFQNWFLNWSSDKTYYLVTGSNKEKTIDQVGQEIFDKAKISFNCLGNSIWIDGTETRVNQLNLKPNELSFIEEIINTSIYPYKFGGHIEYRHGSVNISTVGRNANKEERKNYYEWDMFNGERNRIIKQITRTFPRLEVFKGGMVSLDITLKNCNKSQCYDLICEDSGDHDIKFFADRIYPSGIDKPLADVINHFNGQVYDIKNGYKQTWEILKTL